jgi:MFS family permease
MTVTESRQGALASRDFRLFLAMRLPANLAVQVQSVAVGWQVYDLTHRPLDLGLVGLAQFLPVFGFALIAGHVADQFDRRRILAACLGLQLLCSALLIAATLHGLKTIWPIYAILVLFGTARAFSAPATQSLLPNLVPREALGSAFAWNSSGFQSMTIAGPALGGLIYGFGPAAAYAVAAGLALVAVAAALSIRARLVPAENRGMDWNSLVAGIRFIRGRRDILGAISLDLFAVLFGGATALLPVFAGAILHAGPVGLGLLRGAPGAGALIVSLTLSRRPLTRHLGPVMFAAVALFGAATILFGLSRALPLSIICLATLGGADVVSVVIRSTLVQMRTPDDMRGRVAAVNLLFIGSSNQLGEFESGALAALIGAVPAVVAGGACTLAVAALGMTLFPSLRRLDRLT